MLIKKGQHLSVKTEFKKGIIPWNKGKKLPFIPHPKAVGRVVWNKGINDIDNQGSNHFAWKGSNASYSSVHKWIVNYKGKPKKCVVCKTTEAKKYEWANVDHKYRRNLEDYIRMCTKCHKKYDKFNMS